MLRFLRIQHLAVIDRLELEFDPGLTVLTGETGAGKSILVGAVGLLVGGRASADLVRTGEDQAVIEAIFETPDGREVIARREISALGRSRALIDGVLMTSGALRDTCGGLVDLHGQHEHQLLLDPASHLDLLDAFGGLNAVPVADAWAEVTRIEADLLQARDQAETAERDRDYLAHSLSEIDALAPEAGEETRLAVAAYRERNATPKGRPDEPRRRKDDTSRGRLPRRRLEAGW